MALKVRYKPTGQLGTIPDDKFDPNLFELVGAGSGAPATPAPSKQTGQIISPEQLIKLSLLDPKGADKYKALYDVVNNAGMPEMSAAEQKKQDARGELAQSAQQALDFFEKNKDKNLTGIGQGGFIRKIREYLPESSFGSISSEQTEAAVKLADINRRLALSSEEGGGKSFTGPEKEILSGIIFDVSKDENVTRNQLKSLLRTLGVDQNNAEGITEDLTSKDKNRNIQDTKANMRTRTSVEQGQPSDSAGNIIADILKQGASGAFPVANPEVYKLLDKIGLGSLGNIPAAGYEGVRSASTMATNLTGNPNTMTGNNPYLSAEKAQALSEGGTAAARNIAGEGLQGLSYAIPFGKGANILSKVLAPGAGVGLLSGTGERLEKGAPVSAATMAKDIATGAATGWIIDKAGRVISGTGKTLKGKASNLVNKLLKPGKAGIDFNAKTGLDFADEILKKDGKNISGKNMDEIEKYFETKYEAMEGAADSYLRSSGETMPKDDIIKIIDDQIDTLTSPGRDISTDLVRELQVTRDAINTVPGDLPLDVWNQTKRDWYQKSTFTAGGDTTKSAAYKSLARSLNDMLEKKAPGFKGVNKDIMLYRLAKDSASRQAQSLAQRESGGILSTLAAPVAAGGIAAGAATGNPLFAALGMLPAVKEVSRMPQVRAGAANVLNKTPSTQIPDFLMKLLLQGGTRLGSGQR